MKPPFVPKSLSAQSRRRIDLAIAVAQERLLSTHVDHALDLIELVGDQLPFDDALGIYTRLLRLTEDEARIITTRALAVLGERGDQVDGWTPAPERAREPATDGTSGRNGKERRSLIRHLRQRLRGRTNDELRAWSELEAARTEVALLDAHVENALNFVDILDKELPFTEAVELYLEALEVRDSIAEVVYYISLSRLNEKRLPPRKTRSAPRVEPAPAGATEERRLRVVDRDGA